MLSSNTLYEQPQTKTLLRGKRDKHQPDRCRMLRTRYLRKLGAACPAALPHTLTFSTLTQEDAWGFSGNIAVYVRIQYSARTAGVDAKIPAPRTTTNFTRNGATHFPSVVFNAGNTVAACRWAMRDVHGREDVGDGRECMVVVFTMEQVLVSTTQPKCGRE